VGDFGAEAQRASRFDMVDLGVDGREGGYGLFLVVHLQRFNTRKSISLIATIDNYLDLSATIVERIGIILAKIQTIGCNISKPIKSINYMHIPGETQAVLLMVGCGPLTVTNGSLRRSGVDLG
jgi:hypothetical protein